MQDESSNAGLMGARPCWLVDSDVNRACLSFEPLDLEQHSGDRQSGIAEARTYQWLKPELLLVYPSFQQSSAAEFAGREEEDSIIS